MTDPNKVEEEKVEFLGVEDDIENLGDVFLSTTDFNFRKPTSSASSVMNKSNISTIPSTIAPISDNELKISRKKWGVIEKTDLTEEQKRDLKTIALIGHVDRRVSKNRVDWDLDNLPTNFHFGKIEDSAYDRYSRLTRKQRGETILEETLINNAQLRSKARETVDAVNQVRNDGYLAFQSRRKNKSASKKRK